MMGVIRRTPTSHRDYGAIWDYVAEHGNPIRGGIEVARVIHGARNLDTIFKRRRP